MACHGDPAKSRGNNLYPLEAMSHISRALYAERRPVGNFIAFLFYAPFYGKVGAPLSTALPHLWWENYRKKYGAGCARKEVGEQRARSVCVGSHRIYFHHNIFK